MSVKTLLKNYIVLPALRYLEEDSSDKDNAIPFDQLTNAQFFGARPPNNGTSGEDETCTTGSDCDP